MSQLSQHQIQIRDLVPLSWFKDKEKSSFIMRIYSCLGIPFDNISEIVQKTFEGSDNEGNVVFGLSVLGGFRFPANGVFLCSDKSGMPLLKVEARNFDLPESTYVFLLTPKKVDGLDEMEHSVKQRLDISAGILRGHMGLNLMRDLIFEGEFEAGRDAYSSPGNPIRLPKEAEGPFLNREVWEQSKAVREAIKIQSNDLRRRLEVAIELFNKAMDGDERFFYYWTALEVLCGGTSQSIRNKIKKSLGLKSLQEVIDIGFGTVARWRHDFIHHGVRPFLTADVERYLQLLFLDLIRHELGMEPVFHTLTLIQHPLYDLKSIGVSKK